MMQLKSRLEARTRGIPVVIPCAVAAIALAVLAAKQVALISPPWFSGEMAQQCVRYFQSQGFEIAYSAPADLPSDQQAIQPEQLYDWVRSHVPKMPKGFSLAATAFARSA